MFIDGFEYDRQEPLNFVGSKQNQSGIIWRNKEHGCIIVSSGGKHGDSAAICPNCHKEAHYGIRKYNIRDELASIISRKELEII